MKTFVAGLVILATGAASGTAWNWQESADSSTETQTVPFMRVKLVASQDVLNGLVTENFGLIRQGASDMKRMSQAVQWPTADDRVYEHYGVEFRRQCDKLMNLADAGNLEGAHYTWLHMTSTCIDCHNYVRGKFRVEPNASDPQGPIRLIPTDWEGKTFRNRDARKDGDR